MTTLNVPPVAAALAFVPERKVAYGEEYTGEPVACGTVATGRMTVEWVTGDEPIEPGTRVQIRAGESDGWAPDGWRWETEMDGSFDHLALKDDPRVTAWLRPGEVIGTATVAECVPITEDIEQWCEPIACVQVAPNRTELAYWPVWAVERGEDDDISGQRLDQDWSPTTECKWCEGRGGPLPHRRLFGANPCRACDASGTMGRWAYKLTDAEDVDR